MYLEEKLPLIQPELPAEVATKIQKERDLNSTEEDLTNPSEVQDNKEIS